jgi:hypothetical protein
MNNNEIGVKSKRVPTPLQYHALSALDIPARRAHMLITTRHDAVTAQKVEVGIIFQAMLGPSDAKDYMLNNGVPLEVALRVLNQPQRRRGCHNAFGVRTDSPKSGTENTGI